MRPPYPFLLLSFLFPLPALSFPRPLPSGHNGHNVERRMLCERRMPCAPVRAETPKQSRTELPAAQSSGTKHLPLLLRDTPNPGSPVTTFDDGLVLYQSSGVAQAAAPPSTPPAIITTPTAPSSVPQVAQPQTSAVQNPPGPFTTAAAQQASGNLDRTTIPSSSRWSTSPVATFPPANGNLNNAIPTTLYINSAHGTTTAQPSVTRSTKPLTFTSGGATWVMDSSVTIFTTVDGNGQTYTTSALLTSITQLTAASTDSLDHHGPSMGPDDKSQSGNSPPPFSRAAIVGVIIAAVLASLAFCWIFVLIRRRRLRIRKREELHSINSKDDYRYTPQRTGSPFSGSGRHSFRSDSSSTDEWHSRTRAELKAMEEVSSTAVTVTRPQPSTPLIANYGAHLVAPTYTHVQAHTDSKSLMNPSGLQANEQIPSFADHAVAPYTAATEPAPVPLIPLSPPASSVPYTNVGVQQQQHSPQLPDLTPLTRVKPLRPRSRSPSLGVRIPPTPSSTSFGSFPSPPSTAQTTRTPGSSRPLPPPRIEIPLLKRIPTPLQSSTGGTRGSGNPFADPWTGTGEEDSQVQVVERFDNPFADIASLSDEVVTTAHAHYFPEFTPAPGELGPSRESVEEDVLGLYERRHTLTGRSDAGASVTPTTTERERLGRAGVVVPILSIQAPSAEDGMSVESSEMDMGQSLDDEHLFYNGGPRGFAAFGAFVSERL